MKITIRSVSVFVALAMMAGVLLLGIRVGLRVAEWRRLDATYAETFRPPKEIAGDLDNRRILYHIKTSLATDDSQICVGFNVIFAALEAGADVIILFDSGAVADLNGNLEATGVPVRLKKIIAAQMNLPLEEMPDNYKEYLELLHGRGAGVYANTAMLIVAGLSDKVKKKFVGYPFIEPATYAKVASLQTQAQTIVVY